MMVIFKPKYEFILKWLRTIGSDPESSSDAADSTLCFCVVELLIELPSNSIANIIEISMYNIYGSQQNYYCCVV